MTNSTTGLSTIALALVLALSVVAGTAVAASNASIAADDTAPGTTTTHTVTVTVGDASAGSWNGLAANYSDTGADLGNVGQGDVTKIGIDRDDDESGATIDTDVSDDLSSAGATNDGETLRIGLGGSYELNAGDEIVVVYEDAENPSEAGDYDVGMDVNYQSSGGEATASLAVGSSDDSTSTSDGDTATTSGDDSDGADDDSTADETTADETTADDGSGSTPGFGVAAATAALAALALLARTRN